MGDLDLADALEGSHEFSDTEFESCCFNMTDVQEEIFRLNEGLDLVVSHDPRTMRSVAFLLLAVNKMKSLTHCGSELTGERLCSKILDSLVEETIVKTTVNLSREVKKLFRRMSSEEQCTLCDMSQKDLVHKSEFKLQAITLKGANSERKVNFRLSKYITESPGQGEPVVLSINNSLHFSCTMNGKNAELNLEKCSEENLSSISDGEDMSRFLFYKKTTGKSLTTFESVKCPGWFISTYEDEEQPVEMCQVDEARRLTHFKTS